MLVNIRSHVTSLIKQLRGSPGTRQCLPGHDFGVETPRIGPLKSVAGVIRLLLQKSADNFVDDFRLNERAIRRDPNDGIRFESPSRAIVAIEDIIFVPAKDVHSQPIAFIDNYIIGGIARCGNDDLPGEFRPLQSLHHSGQYGSSGNIQQHFAGQPGTPHSCLNNGYGSHITPISRSSRKTGSNVRAYTRLLASRSWRRSTPFHHLIQMFRAEPLHIRIAGVTKTFRQPTRALPVVLFPP